MSGSSSSSGCPIYFPIDFADSVQDVVNLNHPYAQRINDRSNPIDDEFVAAILRQSVMCYDNRRPSPALDADGNFVGTNFDLCSFLVPVAQRGAVIEIPDYEIRRPSVSRANERRISGGPRFGKVTGLISNQKVFSFSVRIFDQSVIITDPVTDAENTGAHRNFMLVDLDGYWHEGWRKIVWHPTAKENDFLRHHRLWVGNHVTFSNWLHPNRWSSVFSAHHLLKKWLLARLDDEIAFCKVEISRLQNAKYQLPVSESAYIAPSETGSAENIAVKTLEFQLEVPSFAGRYLAYYRGQSGIQAAYQRKKHLTYTIKPQVQFPVRANECAYFIYGGPKNGFERIAYWMGSCSWQDWKKPRGKIVWRRMALSKDFALLYRVKTCAQQVAASSI